MIDLEAAFLRLDADLRALRLPWALVGGFAVSLRSEPRTTRDIDLAIVVTGDEEAEQVSVALGCRAGELRAGPCRPRTIVQGGVR